ncbi:MFS transporter [Pseudochelatococcus sp. B33]
MQTLKAVPLIVASSLIMQQIDSTAITTALPSMAVDLEVPLIGLHSAVTTYLLSLTVFLPISGWLADRFGARRTFCAAIGLFTLASLACAASVNLPMLLLSRFVQGFGAAMMLPTARLILVRSVPRSELVSAMVLMSMPTVIGPAVGPLLGGFITGISSWRWIFWINLPFGVLAIALTLLLIKEIPQEERSPFDFTGFILAGFGIGAVVFCLDSLPRGLSWELLVLALAGFASIGLYIRHSSVHPGPILDLDLFRYPTFRASLLGGSFFRIGFGALPFMLPLLMQEVLGYTPLQSGAMTFISAIGALGMRTVTQRILRRFGFRSVLFWNALIASSSVGMCAAFTPGTAPALMMSVIFAGGFFRALQFTGANTLAFADVPDAKMSHATSLAQMGQRISQGVGVATAAGLLHFFSGGSSHLTSAAFSMSFLVIAAVSAASCLSFFMLPKTAGDVLAGREKDHIEEAGA